MKVVRIPSETISRMRRVAPEHPPCFADRNAWVDWLGLAQISGDPLVTPFKPEKNREFDRGLSFCADCNPEHSERMARVGRCRPTWLSAREDERCGRVCEAELAVLALDEATA